MTSWRKWSGIEGDRLTWRMEENRKRIGTWPIPFLSIRKESCCAASRDIQDKIVLDLPISHDHRNIGDGDYQLEGRGSLG